MLFYKAPLQLVRLTDPLSWKDDINRETSSALFITCFIALGNWCPFL